MRTLIFLFFSALFSSALYAQVPEQLNYQAVARNNQGVALSNQTIQARLSIVRGASTLYTETRLITTNLLGLFNVQIGSPGATSSSGVFADINWAANTPNPTQLKVELDLTNTNIFTDMGTQPFSTVPTAFWAEKSIEVLNLAGRYIDPVTVPTIGARLSWDGNGWTPVKKDASIYISGLANSIPAGGANAPWAWAGQTLTTSLIGDESISAAFTVPLGHGSGSPVPVVTGVCYQSLPNGNITSFDASFTWGQEFDIPVNTTALRTMTSAVGKRSNLPAGSYKIGMCIKNKSGTGVSLNNNDYVNGVIEIKYKLI